MTWLGYGAPLWLAGLAALALPIAIHLLSRGRQRRMPVGSVRWLEAAETLRARRVRPSRWWLLALRCLLLATVALALSGPRLGGPALSAPAPWVLVSPEVASKRADLEPGNETAYRALDAALAAGAELRWLLPGLPAGTFDRVPEPATAGVWSLLREADLLAPAAASFAVFDGGLLAGLAGERPAFGRAVEWWSVVDRRANRWLERASELDDGRLGVVVGNSEGAATRFAT